MVGHDNETDKRRAFGRLFRDNYPKLYFYVLNIIGDQHTAEDIAEDVFAQLWKQFGTGDTSPDDRHLLSFLYTLARNKSLDHLRRVSVRNKYEEAMRHETFDDDGAAAHQERIETVMRLVGELPTQTQRVFRACLIEGHTYKEAAQQYGISVNTVKTYITRGLAYIREEMKNKNDSSDSARVL